MKGMVRYKAINMYLTPAITTTSTFLFPRQMPVQAVRTGHCPTEAMHQVTQQNTHSHVRKNTIDICDDFEATEYDQPVHVLGNAWKAQHHKTAGTPCENDKCRRYNSDKDENTHIKTTQRARVGLPP